MSASRPHVFSTIAVTNAAESAANTETIVATLSGVSSEFAQQPVQMFGIVAVTPGTTASAMTLRIRQETLTGTLIGVADVHAGDIQPSKLSGLEIMKTDASRECAGATYVLTVQGTGEGTAAAIAAVSLMAIVS